MTEDIRESAVAEVKALLEGDGNRFRLLLQMTEPMGAGRGERTADRLGYRAGHYPRSLVTRVGKLELRVGSSLARTASGAFRP